MLFGELFGLFFFVDGANRFCRMLESRIIRIDLGLRENGGQSGGFWYVVDEFLLDHVPDHADGFCANHVQGIHRNFLIRIVLQRKQPHLRTVAVRDNKFITSISLGNLSAGQRYVFTLVFTEHRFAAL